MPWLMFVLAAGAIWLAFSTFSIGLAAVCLVAALGLIVAGALMLASARISGLSQNPARMMDAQTIEAVRRRAVPAVAANGDVAATKKPLTSEEALEAPGGADAGRAS